MTTVTVRGVAELDVEPDRVRLVVTLQAEAVQAADAVAQLAARSTEADRALDAAGDGLLLRRPSSVSLQPAWSPGGEVSGQAALRTIAVEARAGGPLGDLVSRLAAIPGTTLGGTEWRVDSTNPVHARLRAAAVTDAQARAADYARAAGLRLGALDWIAEPGVERPGDREVVALASSSPAAMGMRAEAPVLELRPEPVAVSATVDVRWTLLPGPPTDLGRSGQR